MSRCLYCAFHDKEVEHARIEDNSTYRCMGCGEVSDGIAQRIGYGWVCSSDCAEKYEGRLRDAGFTI